MLITLRYLGRTLQLMGLATLFLVIIIFFGRTEMVILLKLTILGIVEFYGGYFLVRWAS